MSLRLRLASALSAPLLVPRASSRGSTHIWTPGTTSTSSSLCAWPLGRLATSRSIRDLEQTLSQIVGSAVTTVPGVDAGSISMTDHDRIETRHPTSDAIAKLDAMQGELFEGPCISAIEAGPEDGIVVAVDFAGADAVVHVLLRHPGDVRVQRPRDG